MTSAITTLMRNTWPDVKWDPDQKPIVVLDGKAHKVADIDTRLDGAAAYVIGMNEKHFSRFCEHVRVDSVHFYEMRVANLSALALLDGLSQLAIRWNTKATDISFLEGMASLQTLILEDTPKINNLSPLASLRHLSAAMVSGGIWNKNKVETLEPFASLGELQELVLLNLQVRSDGLRPLAMCRSLKSLQVSNQFPTEDYAYLSVLLPDTHCEMFAPFVTLGSGRIGEKDVMVVGKRKPFLNSINDADRIAKYQAEFRKLQSKAALD